MILPPLQYLRPDSVEHATTLLTEVDGSAVLAGGQTLLNALKLDLAHPTALVDVHRLPELQVLEVDSQGTLRIGAGVTYATLAAAPLVGRTQPAIAEMAAGLVDRQVRNRGTIGGNCCLNDPTSNFPPLLTALDARFAMTGPAARRTLDAGEFFRGTLATALRTGELLTGVVVPALPATTRLAHRHLQLGVDSWATARAVVRLDVTDGVVTEARLVLGCVRGSPQRLVDVERQLVGRAAGPSLAEEAADAVAAAEPATVDDGHCSAAYRREMTVVQVRRAVRAAVEGRLR